MQIVVNVMAKPAVRKSLREIVISDLQSRRRYRLEVQFEKKMGRPKGWAKIKAQDLRGALNLTWHGDSRMLVVRAIAKRGNDPGALVARFLGYMMERRRRAFETLVVRTL